MKLIITVLLSLFVTVAFASKAEPILLSNQGYLELPKKYEFLPASKAIKIMSDFGNPVDQDFLGLVLPKQDQDVMGWFIVVRFKKVGYVNTENISILSSKEILQTIQQRLKTLSAIEIIGWQDAPHYNTKKHQLSWGLLHKGSNLKEAVVNKEVFVLTREGMLDFSLVTYASLIENHQQYLQEVIDAVHFAKNKNYGEYKEGDAVSDLTIVDIISGKDAPKNNDWTEVGEKMMNIFLAIIL